MRLHECIYVYVYIYDYIYIYIHVCIRIYMQVYLYMKSLETQYIHTYNSTFIHTTTIHVYIQRQPTDIIKTHLHTHNVPNGLNYP